MHLASPRDHAVEEVDECSLLILGCAEAVGAAQQLGDERWGELGAREYAFVHRRDEQRVEVERTRLEDTHHLQSLERHPLEIEHFARDDALHEIEHRGILQIYPCLSVGALQIKVAQMLQTGHCIGVAPHEGLLERHRAVGGAEGGEPHGGVAGIGVCSVVIALRSL